MVNKLFAPTRSKDSETRVLCPATQCAVVGFPLVARVSCPRFADVEECAELAGLVGEQLGVYNVRFGLFQTLWFSLAMTATTLTILPFVSASTKNELERVDPR